MNTPPIVSTQEWKAAREQLLVKEKELTRARDALAAERRRMPRMAVEKDYAFEGPDGPVEPARPVRGATSADRLPLLLRARRARMAGGRLPGLLDGRRSGGAPRSPERPRHHARVRLPRSAGRHRALEGTDGLGGDPLVHAHRRLRRRLRRRRVARHQRLPPRRRRRIFRTYFVDKRGDEVMGGTWSYLDITALGRQEIWEDSPEGYPQTQAYGWWNRHDEYENGGQLRSRPVGGDRFPARLEEHLMRDRSRRRGAGGGAPAAVPDRRRGRRPARRPGLDRVAAATSTGAAKMSAKTTLRMERTYPGARRAGVRRLDQPGGDAPLVARRARLGDGRGRGRPARRRRRPGGHARPATRRSSTAAAAATRSSTRRTAWRSPGSGTTCRTRP